MSAVQAFTVAAVLAFMYMVLKLLVEDHRWHRQLPAAEAAPAQAPAAPSPDRDAVLASEELTCALETLRIAYCRTYPDDVQVSGQRAAEKLAELHDFIGTGLDLRALALRPTPTPDKALRAIVANLRSVAHACNGVSTGAAFEYMLFGVKMRRRSMRAGDYVEFHSLWSPDDREPGHAEWLKRDFAFQLHNETQNPSPIGWVPTAEDMSATDWEPYELA